MPQTVEVRFKGNRKGLFDWAGDEDLLRMRDPVIVGRTRNSTPWPWLACVDGLVSFECFANEAC